MTNLSRYVWQDAASTAPADEGWSDQPLLESLARIVAREPDRLAVRSAVGAFSYHALWSLIVWLGNAIAKAPAGPGAIAILLPDDTQYVAAMFAGLIARRACLPLDNANPPRRNDEIMQAADVAVVVHRAGDHSAIEAAGRRATVAIGDDLVVPDAPFESIRSQIGLDEPAYIVSTSGSTGLPKLIVHSQRTLAFRAYHTRLMVGLGAGDRCVFAGGSPSAYGRVEHVLPPLLVGASLHIMNIGREGIRGLLQRLHDERITHLRTAVSLVRTIARLPITKDMLTHLRVVRFGSEQPLHSDIALLRPIVPPACRIINVYSSTESVQFSWRVPADDRRDTVRVPAGFIIPGAEAVLLDDGGAVCTPGDVGELVVRSRYNAIGEWQDGQCAPGRFLTDPDAPEDRIYFTGDLARQSDDGAYIIVGRKDRQLKINGQRVEPIEIEGAIREIPGVSDVAVLPKTSGETTLLLAFVVAEPPASDDLVRIVRDRLQDRLPPYMVPARITLLLSLPRLPGGKVDGVALLAREP